MCLGIPMKVVRINGDFAWVKTGGLTRQINIQMVPSAILGDYVIVHAGFAIQKLDNQQAKKTLDLLKEIR